MTKTFTVPGVPQGKARARIVRLADGRSHSFTPGKTVLYENLVRTEYQRQCGKAFFGEKTPVTLKVSAYYSVPQSVSRATKTLMLDGVIRPTKKPDCDNICKVISDALNGIAYHDDAQIVECGICKYYAIKPRVDVLIKDIK